MKLSSFRNYIVIKNISELYNAKTNNLCLHIIYEDNNVIHMWDKILGKWVKSVYVAFDDNKEFDYYTSGFKAYQNFYKYCGEEEVERMKHILKPIEVWESEEQIHFANLDFIDEKIYKNIYVFDVNSSFTYGVMQLQAGFEKLKEYFQNLYELKKNAPNRMLRSRYKNLQNYLIGYFARVKEFISLRSEIIRLSNKNIRLKIGEIHKNKGTVYLSSTDSIITDDKGAQIMNKYIGNELGQFKLELKSNKLCYRSSNCYQVGDKIVYSGVGYFARKHVNLFEDVNAVQKGRLIEPYDFIISDDEDNMKVCKVRYGRIIVTKVNKLKETIDTIVYEIKGE